MNCSSCNSTVPIGSKFCLDCGQSVSKMIACTSCNQDTPATAKFCSNCGETLVLKSQSPVTLNSSTVLIKKVEAADLEVLSRDFGRVPYGFFGLIVSNEQVVDLIQEGARLGDERNRLSKFISDLKNALKQFVGASAVKPTIYVVADLNLLPVAEHKRAYQLPTIGEIELKHRFIFSRSKANLSKVVANLMSTCDELTVSSFVDLCAAQLEVVESTMPHDLLIGSPEWCGRVQSKFLQVTGLELLTSQTDTDKGLPKTIEIGNISDRTVCAACGETGKSIFKFCESCGSSNLRLEDSDGAIRDSEGNKIILRVGYRLKAEVAERDLYSAILDHLSHRVRELSLAELKDGLELRSLETSLNSTVPANFKYCISEFHILDLKTEAEDWAFKTADLMDAELRNAKFLKDRMVLTRGAEEDYQNAVFELSLRKRQRMLAENRSDLQNQLDHTEMETEFFQQEKSLEQSRRDVELESQKAEIARMSQLDDVKQTAVDQELAHTRQREREDAGHAIQMQEEQLSAELAAREKNFDATISEERISKDLEIQYRKKEQELDNDHLQSKVNLEEQQLDSQSEREMRKLEAMGQMERAMSQQDSQVEIERINAMKDLAPQAILALQAVEISKQAAPDTVANVVENISGKQESNEFYERLLAEKQLSKDELKQALGDSNEALLRSNTSLADTISKTAESRLDGFKEAASAARSTNEKSMESMAKVASSAAQRKEASVVVATPCVNTTCTYKFTDKVGKFCPICGEAQ